MKFLKDTLRTEMQSNYNWNYAAYTDDKLEDQLVWWKCLCTH